MSISMNIAYELQEYIAFANFSDLFFSVIPSSLIILSFLKSISLHPISINNLVKPSLQKITNSLLWGKLFIFGHFIKLKKKSSDPRQQKYHPIIPKPPPPKNERKRVTPWMLEVPIQRKSNEILQNTKDKKKLDKHRILRHKKKHVLKQK